MTGEEFWPVDNASVVIGDYTMKVSDVELRDGLMKVVCKGYGPMSVSSSTRYTLKGSDGVPVFSAPLGAEVRETSNKPVAFRLPIKIHPER